MSRPRQFDAQQVTRRVRDRFWVHGYHATSLDDLLAVSGLSKSSLYASFGGKRELVLAAIADYREAMLDGPLAPLQYPEAGRSEIEATLRAIAAIALTPDGQRGCFVNNCLAELAPHDDAVLDATRGMRDAIAAAFAAAVARGQAAGTIAAREAPRALARFLVNTLAGLNLAAKAKPDAATLDDIVRIALRALD